VVGNDDALLGAAGDDDALWNAGGGYHHPRRSNNGSDVVSDYYHASPPPVPIRGGVPDHIGTSRRGGTLPLHGIVRVVPDVANVLPRRHHHGGADHEREGPRRVSVRRHTQSRRRGVLEELAPAVLRTRAREPPAEGFLGGGDAARDDGRVDVRRSSRRCRERGGEGGSGRPDE